MASGSQENHPTTSRRSCERDLLRMPSECSRAPSRRVHADERYRVWHGRRMVQDSIASLLRATTSELSVRPLDAAVVPGRRRQIFGEVVVVRCAGRTGTRGHARSPRQPRRTPTAGRSSPTRTPRCATRTLVPPPGSSPTRAPQRRTRTLAPPPGSSPTRAASSPDTAFQGSKGARPPPRRFGQAVSCRNQVGRIFVSWTCVVGIESRSPA